MMAIVIYMPQAYARMLNTVRGKGATNIVHPFFMALVGDKLLTEIFPESFPFHIHLELCAFLYASNLLTP
jgi:hypothetical protein